MDTFIVIISILPERRSLNVNQGRAPMTVTTVQSAWRQNGTASTWRRPSLMQMGSRWSSSQMTKGTSRRQRRAACWCTNVSGLSSEKENIMGHSSKSWFNLHPFSACRSLLRAPHYVLLDTSIISDSISFIYHFVTSIYSLPFQVKSTSRVW